MFNDTFGDLVLCPGCGTIQDASEVCIKCGTLLLVGRKPASSREKEKTVSKEKEKTISKEKEKITHKEKTACLSEAPAPQKKNETTGKTKVSLLTLRKTNKSKTVPRKRHGSKDSSEL